MIVGLLKLPLTPYAMRKIMSCGVLIVRGNPIEEFLLMEHKDRLDLPKGHVDPGETEMQCALRELVEETGVGKDDIQIDPDFRFEHCYSVWPKKFKGEECAKTLVIFLATLVCDTQIEVTEHEGYRWVKWDAPHAIQEQTIDPLLSSVEEFVRSRKPDE